MDPAARLKLDADLARLADGDRAAFDGAFAVLWPIVLNVCMRLLGSKADAEDAAQQALTKMFTDINEYDVDRSALSWTLGIAAWECRALRTKRARRRESGGDDAATVASDAPSPEDEVMKAEFLEATSDVLGRLSASDQETLRAAFEGSLHATGATFRKRRERAVDRLRIAWRKLHGTF